jgi:hypothetical protein
VVEKIIPCNVEVTNINLYVCYKIRKLFLGVEFSIVKQTPPKINVRDQICK